MLPLLKLNIALVYCIFLIMTIIATLYYKFYEKNHTHTLFTLLQILIPNKILIENKKLKNRKILIYFI